jgi:hypothetical protein
VLHDLLSKLQIEFQKEFPSQMESPVELAEQARVDERNKQLFEKTKAIKVNEKTFEKAVKRLINFGDYYSDKQAEQVEWFIERNDIQKITRKRLQIIEINF